MGDCCHVMQASAPPSCTPKVVWIIIVLLQSKHLVRAFHPPPKFLGIHPKEAGLFTPKKQGS